MYLSLINLLPIFFTFSAAFGVFLHDNQVDRAVVSSFVAPVQEINVGSLENDPTKFNDLHIHTETITVSSNHDGDNSQPGVQPRTDKKYIVQKKLVSNSAGGDYLWPSI